VRRFGRVALGGTFDRFHLGHEALLGTAFRVGREVAIGLTTERFLAEHPKPGGRAIGSWASRRGNLARWLRKRFPARRWTIVPLQDRFGGAVEEGVDALVVSADTVEGGRAVNRERRRRGRSPVPLVVVPLVLGDDLEPVSSRRIRAGEIDRDGHRVRPPSVGIIVGSAPDRWTATRGIRRAFPRARVQGEILPALAEARTARVRQLTVRAVEGRDLGVVVAPRRPSGWTVGVRGRHGALDPRRLPGGSPVELELGIARLLRPAPPKPL
jgi:pantetheine-phosphate adenylyltransferase